MADEQLYAGYGLRIRSSIALPGAIPLPHGDLGQADIDIAHGTIPDCPSARASGVYRVTSADRFEVLIPDVGRFACRDRRHVVVDPDPDADPAHVAELIVATVLPALLWARGEIVLHAAAFIPFGGSKAVAVMGASGSGKSTVLATALTQGARMLADDSVCIRPVGDGFGVTGLAGGYFERTGQKRVFREAASGQRDYNGGTLGAVFVLSARTPTPRRLPTREAMEAVLRHRHRPRIATLLGLEPTILSEMAAIVRKIPIVAVRAFDGVLDHQANRRE